MSPLLWLSVKRSMHLIGQKSAGSRHRTPLAGFIVWVMAAVANHYDVSDNTCWQGGTTLNTTHNVTSVDDCKVACNTDARCELFNYQAGVQGGTCYTMASWTAPGLKNLTASKWPGAKAGSKLAFVNCRAGWDVIGQNLNQTTGTASLDDCMSYCAKIPGCQLIVRWHDGTCFAKGLLGTNGVSGPRADVVDASCTAVTFSNCRAQWNLIGTDLYNFATTDLMACKAFCASEPKCDLFVYGVGPRCWMKAAGGTDGADGVDAAVIWSCMKQYPPS